jgi:hypothetical protein
MNLETRECSAPADLSTVEQLEAHLQALLGSRVRDFQVVLRDGGLVLRGRTHTYYAKQVGQHAVMENHSLPIVANEIEVY